MIIKYTFKDNDYTQIIEKHLEEYGPFLGILHKTINDSIEFKENVMKNDEMSNNEVKRPKKNIFVGSFYSENELNILFEKSKNDPLHLVILLTAFYGLRRSKVLGLKWSAIDFENKTITIKHTIVEVKIKGTNRILGKDRTKTKASKNNKTSISKLH